MVVVPCGLLEPSVSLGRKVKVRNIYEIFGAWVYQLQRGLLRVGTYLGG